MMKHLLSFILLAFVATTGIAQDVITKKNGEGVQAKVLEITPTEIKYKRFENPDGPTYTLAKADVLLVKYANNTEEIFTGTDSFIQGNAKPTNDVQTAGTLTASTTQPVVSVETTPVVTYNTTTLSPAELYNKGQQDAKVHYKGYKGAGTGTLVTTLLLSPLVGLVPAIVTSSVKPQDQNLDYPNHELMKNEDYSTGYKYEARKTKNRKVWTNWGIGFGVILTYVLVAGQ
jgi:uncharacterized protein YcfL